jgi:hypothetical protein
MEAAEMTRLTAHLTVFPIKGRFAWSIHIPGLANCEPTLGMTYKNETEARMAARKVVDRLGLQLEPMVDRSK